MLKTKSLHLLVNFGVSPSSNTIKNSKIIQNINLTCYVSPRPNTLMRLEFDHAKNEFYEDYCVPFAYNIKDLLDLYTPSYELLLTTENIEELREQYKITKLTEELLK